MTKSTITRERLEWLSQISGRDDIEDVDGGEIRELARAQLAAMDSEPVTEVLSSRPGNDTPTIDRALPVGTTLYRHAQPAPKRDQVRNEHAEWSQATFGNVGPIGPLKHLSKEALEAAAEPADLSEWADMQFLLWDAQRRNGITDEQITQAMIKKLAVNKQREWPEPKDGEPRLHIKEQPAPAVTFYRDGIEAAAKWIDQQREAYDSEHGWPDPDTGAFEYGNDAQREYSSTLEELAEGIRALHPNAGNSPAHSDCCPEQIGVSPAQDHGWIPVSERMPEKADEVLCAKEFDGPGDWRRKVGYYLAGKWTVYGASWTPTHWMPLPAAPQEVKGE